MGSTRFAAAALALLAFCLPSTALAVRAGPVMLRIEGFLEAKPEGVPADATWNVTLRGERKPFTATKLRVLSGGLAYYQVVNALEPYPIAFGIKGEAALLDRIAASSPASPVVVVGALTLGPGARILLINSVEALTPEAKKAD